MMKQCVSRRQSLPTLKMHLIHTLLFLSLIGMVPSVVWARGYLDVSGGYKTGDFGTLTRSNLYYFAPAVGYVSQRYDFSVTVPFLSLTNETSGVQKTTENGIGNIILRGGIVLVPEMDNGLSLNGALAVKLPTTDEAARGLGSGKTDYGAFLSLHQRIDKTTRTKLSFMAGYIKIGDSPTFNFNNIYVYAIGISRVFGRTDIYMSFEGRRSVIPDAQNPQEVNFGFFHILNKDYSFKGSTFFGLNNGGPDLGLDLGFVRWF